MTFLDAVPTTFSLEALISAIQAFVTYIFDTTNGPIKMVLDLVTGNQILWVFLAFGICTIGISLLNRIKRIF